ncbi:MAG TPA: double zinc ribbon domain-containing protein, partial [Sphingomonas sp.]
MLPAALLRPFGAFADYALPPRCPACGVPVAADHRFCGACWSGLRF